MVLPSTKHSSQKRSSTGRHSHFSEATKNSSLHEFSSFQGGKNKSWFDSSLSHRGSKVRSVKVIFSPLMTYHAISLNVRTYFSSGLIIKIELKCLIDFPYEVSTILEFHEGGPCTVLNKAQAKPLTLLQIHWNEINGTGKRQQINCHLFQEKCTFLFLCDKICS